MSLDPVLLIACSTESPISVWDLHKGTFLAGFKNNASPLNGLTVLGAHHIVAAQASKGISFWSWHKDQVAQRCFAVEPIVCLATTPDGTYIAGGGPSGTLYIWEAGSGRLLISWPAHYKAVTALTFADDGSVLLSGSEDSVVNAWQLIDVLDQAPPGQQGYRTLNPLHSWSQHTLPVTSIACGAGGADAVVISSSLDCSCKIYSLASDALLRSISLPAPIQAVISDQAEHALYAGATNGTIYEVSLIGAPAASASAWAGAAEQAEHAKLEGHTGAVNSLAVSLDGMHLVSGSADGSARVWDLRTRQPLRVFQTPTKAAISSVLVLPRPLHLAAGQGGRGRSDAQQAGRRGPPRMQPLVPLAKYAGAAGATRPWEGPLVDLPVLTSSREWPTDSPGCSATLGEPVALGGEDTAANGAADLASQCAALEEERNRLQEHLQQALAAAKSWQQLHAQLQAHMLEQAVLPG